jgi:Ca2+-binding RTX toxin-like protein
MFSITIWKDNPRHGSCLSVIIKSVFLLVMVNPHLVYSGTVIGNDFKNYLFGTMQADTIMGEDDNDRLFGLAGTDMIYGGSGGDIIEGDQGNDFLNGNDGNDRIIGGQDADNILAGDGDDILIASYVVNSSSIRDYASDSLMCGLGNDTAYINPEDNDTASADCEIIASNLASVILP